jgi:hypothetical protein
MKMVFLILLLFIAPCCAAVKNGKHLMHTYKYREIDSSHTFLLSYPRSGNTWMRFCLEYLTKRPSLTFKEKERDVEIFSLPLGLSFDLGIDPQKKCIWKAHTGDTMDLICKVTPKRDKLILVVRDYKECILRELRDLPSAMRSLQDPDCSYFQNLKIYDRWNSKNRLLIYYEDFVKNPKEVLGQLLEFLQEEPILLTEFMEQYETWRERSLAFYKNHVGPTESEGIDLHHHANQISDSQLTAMDECVRSHYPHLWTTYLSHY